MKATRRSTLHLQLGQEVIYLLLAVFALTTLILALYFVMKLRNQDDGERIRGQMAQLQRENEALKAERDRAVRDAEQRRKEAAEANRQLHDKPPIINLKEAEGFRFPSGDASLTPPFRTNLGSKVVPEIVRQARRYGANVIEVIGHTDEEPVMNRQTNLDSQLIGFLQSGGRNDLKLDVSDNAGLGMARAASVSQFLISQPELRGFRVLPLSGAQVIKNDESLSTGSEPKESADRRRIEIRVRRPN